METLISGQFGNFCSAVSSIGTSNLEAAILKVAKLQKFGSWIDLFKLPIVALVWFGLYNCYQLLHSSSVSNLLSIIKGGACNGWLWTGGVGEPLSSLLVVLMPADDSGIRRVGSTRFLSESIFVMISIIIIIVSILVTINLIRRRWCSCQQIASFSWSASCWTKCTKACKL